LKNIRLYNNDFYVEDLPTHSGMTALIYISQLRKANNVEDAVFIYNNTFQDSIGGVVNLDYSLYGYVTTGFPHL
jgi:hypothetical protein